MIFIFFIFIYAMPRHYAAIFSMPPFIAALPAMIAPLMPCRRAITPPLFRRASCRHYDISLLLMPLFSSAAAMITPLMLIRHCHADITISRRHCHAIAAIDIIDAAR